MAGERMVNDAPIFLDDAPAQQRAPEAFDIGWAPLPTILVDHPKLGRCRINLSDYDPAVHVRCVQEG